MKPERYRILVIDDEPAITRLLKLNLEQTGRYAVATLNSSKTAVETALEFHPELILLDVVMPDNNGGYLASVFQANPVLKAVPIVFLTAAATKEEVASHRGMIGGLPFLAKPVDMAEVLACLANHLDGTHPTTARAGQG